MAWQPILVVRVNQREAYGLSVWARDLLLTGSLGERESKREIEMENSERKRWIARETY